MTRSPLARVDRRFPASIHGNEWSLDGGSPEGKQQAASADHYSYYFAEKYECKEGISTGKDGINCVYVYNVTRASQQP